MIKTNEFTSRDELAKVTNEYITLLQEFVKKLEIDNSSAVKEIIEELKQTECWFFPLRQSIFGS